MTNPRLNVTRRFIIIFVLFLIAATTLIVELSALIPKFLADLPYDYDLYVM